MFLFHSPHIAVPLQSFFYNFPGRLHHSCCPSNVFISDLIPPGAKTIKKNTNSTQNKSQTHRAKQYEVTSFLSTDCELSTDTCSKNVYSLGTLSLRTSISASPSHLLLVVLLVLSLLPRGQDYKEIWSMDWCSSHDFVLNKQKTQKW